MTLSISFCRYNFLAPLIKLINNETLYIIGNGFIIEHGIRSQYREFYKYFEKGYPKFLKEMAELYYTVLNPEIFWNNFEEELDKFDMSCDIIQSILKECYETKFTIEK